MYSLVRRYIKTAIIASPVFASHQCTVASLTLYSGLPLKRGITW